jgi:hypothetical protein
MLKIEEIFGMITDRLYAFLCIIYYLNILN